MVRHIRLEHGFPGVSIHCNIDTDEGVCQWMCGSQMGCYTQHAKAYHKRIDSGKGGFSEDSWYLTAATKTLACDVSYWRVA